jgi:hypothetical protein
VYRCCNNQLFIIKGGVKLDNRWIVHYNLEMLKNMMHTSIQSGVIRVFIKYMFKYVTKGSDCSKAYLQKIRNGEDTPLDEETDARDEVKEYLDARYNCNFDSC